MDEIDLEDLDLLDFDDLTTTNSSSGDSNIYHSIPSTPKRASNKIVSKGGRGKPRVLSDEERAAKKKERNLKDRLKHRQKAHDAQDEILMLKQQIQNYKDKSNLIFFHLSELAKKAEVLTEEKIEEIYMDNDLSEFMSIILD
jgi:hypothetical protein